MDVVRRTNSGNGSWGDYSAYSPTLPEYDAITWLGIGLAIGANALIAVLAPRPAHCFASPARLNVRYRLLHRHWVVVSAPLFNFCWPGPTRARVSLFSLLGRLQVSLNIQKFAHMKNEALGENRKPYHKIPLWWCGMAVNAVGEIGNLVAYGYAEATVVTPIGAVGVIFSAIIATYLLKEKFQR